jgi:hypothetical protein
VAPRKPRLAADEGHCGRFPHDVRRAAAVVDANFDKVVARLGAVPPKGTTSTEHFRIAIQCQKEITDAAKQLLTLLTKPFQKID